MVVEPAVTGFFLRGHWIDQVISVNGPSHHSSQPLVEGVVGLDSDGPLVVKTDPAVSTVHKRSLVVGVPLHSPVRLLGQLEADLVVSQEAVLSSEGALERRLLGRGSHLV